MSKKVKFGFCTKMYYLCSTEGEAAWFPPFLGSKMPKTTSKVRKITSNIGKITFEIFFSTPYVVNNITDFWLKKAVFAARMLIILKI